MGLIKNIVIAEEQLASIQDIILEDIGDYLTSFHAIVSTIAGDLEKTGKTSVDVGQKLNQDSALKAYTLATALVYFPSYLKDHFYGQLTDPDNTKGKEQMKDHDGLERVAIMLHRLTKDPVQAEKSFDSFAKGLVNNFGIEIIGSEQIVDELSDKPVSFKYGDKSFKISVKKALYDLQNTKPEAGPNRLVAANFLKMLFTQAIKKNTQIKKYAKDINAKLSAIKASDLDFSKMKQQNT